MNGEAKGRIVMQSSDGTRWRAEERPCPICGSRRIKELGARGGRAHHEGKGVETRIVRCKDCQVVYTHPTLIPESNPYAKESAEDYFQLHDSQQKILQGERLAKYAEGVLGTAGRMLELGCGRGELLKGALNRGWSVYGVEMTEDYARVARSHGVEIEEAAIENCKSLDQTYDVILLAAVLEHLYDPMKTLERIRNALRPGGLLFIDVPNESSLTMRIGNLYMRARGRDWVINLSPTFSPFHVVGFSPTSLRHALRSVGFSIHRLNVPKWNNALPEGKTTGQKIERLALGLVQSVGEVIGMGDGISCWAIRK
jgi:SAM-dependent methyltransferase